jgi:hypothetical protein
MKAHTRALVTGTNIAGGHTGHSYLINQITGLLGERATGTALTCKAMANRDAHRFATCPGSQLAATASGKAC